jgi:site-specific DNA recombinase
MKAVILSRVSTKEQEEGLSIAAQRQRLADYCERKGLDVIRSFEIVESSTRGERKEFTAMLDFAKAQKEIIAIVADCVDRFQRSFKESVLVDELIRQEKVELHFFREGMVIGKGASSSDIMRWDFSVMGAKAYVLNLSENVRRSLDFKVKNGEWGGKAPIGYLNVRDAEGRGNIVPDPARAPIIRSLFEAYARGGKSISGDLVHMAAEAGLRNKTRASGGVSASQIQHMLLNPFYYGEMRVKGRIQRHKYLPLIDRALFEQCQAVMQGRNRPTASRYSDKPFLFKGLLHCGVSGRVVTSDVKKGRHVYLICRDPADPSRKLFVPEADVLEQVKTALGRLAIEPKLVAALSAHMRESLAAEQDFHASAIEALRRRADGERKRLANLLDMRLDGAISAGEYESKAGELRARLAETTAEIARHEQGDEAFRETMEAVLNIAGEALETFESSNAAQKRALMGFVFSNLKLKGKKLEYSMRSPFDLMAGKRGFSEWLGVLHTLRTTRQRDIIALRHAMPAEFRLAA